MAEGTDTDQKSSGITGLFGPVVDFLKNHGKGLGRLATIAAGDILDNPQAQDALELMRRQALLKEETERRRQELIRFAKSQGIDPKKAEGIPSMMDPRDIMPQMFVTKAGAFELPPLGGAPQLLPGTQPPATSGMKYPSGEIGALATAKAAAVLGHQPTPEEVYSIGVPLAEKDLQGRRDSRAAMQYAPVGITGWTLNRRTGQWDPPPSGYTNPNDPNAKLDAQFEASVRAGAALLQQASALRATDPQRADQLEFEARQLMSGLRLPQAGIGRDTAADKGAAAGAVAAAVEPYKQAAEQRREATAKALEAIRQTGRESLQDLRNQAQRGLEELRQGGREKLEGMREADRAAIASKERIAREKLERMKERAARAMQTHKAQDQIALDRAREEARVALENLRSTHQAALESQRQGGRESLRSNAAENNERRDKARFRAQGHLVRLREKYQLAQRRMKDATVPASEQAKLGQQLEKYRSDALQKLYADAMKNRGLQDRLVPPPPLGLWLSTPAGQQAAQWVEEQFPRQPQQAQQRPQAIDLGDGFTLHPAE